jgi:uncharacterized alkaline shock family protein YloU
MYFKRPSFRRGGATGGNIGGGLFTGSNLGTRTGFQEILGISEAMLEELNRGKPNYSMKAPTSNLGRLLAQYPKAVYGGGLALGAGTGTGIALLADAYQKATKTPLAYQKLKEVSKRPYYFDETNLDFAEGLDEIKKANEIGVAPGFFPRGGKDKFFKDKGLDPETGLPSKDVTDDSFAEARIKMTDTPNYEAVDFTSIAEDVIPNKKDDDAPDDDKGMAAIALSEAIGTPGTIADKAAVLNKSLLSIMAGKKKDRKDIAKLAYTATKEIEKAKIAAGKEGFSEKQFNRMRELKRIIGDTTGTYNEAQKKAAQGELDITTEVIKTIGGKKDQGLSAVDSKLLENLDTLATKLSRIKDKDSDSYRKAYNQYLRARQVVLKNPNLRDIVALADAQVTGALQMENGGRVKKQLGGGTETTAMEVSETVGQGETPTAQVQQLSFSELRNRLPKEITDDVIRLLSNSNEALQDFAYIRTQGDVSKFNTKYGVTLVLPAQTA